MSAHPVVLVLFMVATGVAAIYGWLTVNGLLLWRAQRSRLQRDYLALTTASGLYTLALAMTFVPMSAPLKVQVFRSLWVFGLLSFAAWIAAVQSYVDQRSPGLRLVQGLFIVLVPIPLVDGVITAVTGQSRFYLEAPRPDASVLFAATGNVQQHTALTDIVATLTLLGLLAATAGLVRLVLRSKRPDRVMLVGVCSTGIAAMAEVALSATSWVIPTLFAANLIEAMRIGWISNRRAALEVERLRREQADQTALLAHQLEQSELEERLARVGQNTAQISHDLRNPLTAILGGLTLLESYLPAHDTPAGKEGRELLRLVEHSADHMLTLLRGITRQAQVTQDLPLQTLTAASVVEDAMMLCPELDGLRLDLDIGDVAIRARRVEVIQVLVNLLSNAARAARLASHSWIRIDVTREGEEVRFAVQDSGPRPPAHVRQRMFVERFTTHTDGTGLGLAICRRIIDSHGGAIGIDGDAPTTRIVFTMPAAEPAPV